MLFVIKFFRVNDMYFKFNISKAYRRLARIMEHENTIIYADQLDKLPRHVTKCPAEILALDKTMDETTCLSTNEFLLAPWKPNEFHTMQHVVLRVKQTETKTANLKHGKTKTVCNILATNGNCDLQITAWEPYSDTLSALEKGKVYISFL